jgi:hypothetical protein
MRIGKRTRAQAAQLRRAEWAEAEAMLRTGWLP